MAISQVDTLLAKLRDLFAQEYERGVKHALQRIVDVAQQGGAPARSRITARRKGKPQPRQRAPRGAARALVERVIAESGGAGASASQIGAAAASPVERSVSTSAIRLELYRGKKERRYRVSKGKWSLAKSRKVD